MQGSVLLASALALAAPTLAAPAADAESKDAASFFCYWVDGAHKQVGLTDLFPGRVEQADSITDAFTAAMKRNAKGSSRVYDCGWRRDATQAAADREHLRTAHGNKGFAVLDIDWDPIDG